MPLWLRILGIVAWILSGVSGVVHFNLKKKSRRAIRYATIRFLRSLRDAPLTFLHTSVAWLLQGFLWVYGTTWRRRILASAALSFAYTSLVLASAYWFSDYLTTLRPDKISLEKATDPYLARTSPHAISYALETRVDTISDTPRDFFIHHDKTSLKIRKRIAEFPATFQKQINKSPNRDAIALLTLLEGTYLARGPQLSSLAFLLVFNALVDFGAFWITYALLGWVARTPSIVRYCVGSCCAWLVAGVLFFVTLLPYGELTAGSTDIFWQLFNFPLSVLFCVAMATAGILITASMFTKTGRQIGCLGCVGPVAFLGGVIGVYEAFSAFPSLHFTWPRLWINESINYAPYLLAASGLMPVLLCSIAMLLLAMLRLCGGGARRFVYWYLMWVIQVNKPVLIVICMTPALVVELISRICQLFM